MYIRRLNSTFYNRKQAVQPSTIENRPLRMSSGARTAAGSGSGASVGGTQRRRKSDKRKARIKGRGSGPEKGQGNEFILHLTYGIDTSDQCTKTTEAIIRYTATKFKNGVDVQRSLSDGAVITIPMPPMPVTDEVTRDGLMMEWQTQVDMVLERRQLLETNLASTYALIQGQCSDAVLEKVREQTDFVAVHQARDPIGLLRLLRSVYDSQKHRTVATIELSNSMMSQSRRMSDAEYLEKFRTELSDIELTGGTINIHHDMVSDELSDDGLDRNTATPAQLARAEAAAKSKAEALLFLVRSDQNRYGTLVQELANLYSDGRHCYPSSLTEAYGLMVHFNRVHDNPSPLHGNSGVSVSTVGATAPITAQANTQPNITCHRCNRTGHFASTCAEAKGLDGAVLTMEGVTTDSDLGMTLDFSTDGKASIRVEAYVENMLADLPDNFDGSATNPENEHLFKVNDQAESLSQGNADLFHSTTAKILFLCKRARPDVQTSIAFLCTRVKSPDVDDMKKLRRLVCYLRDTKELGTMLDAAEPLKWFGKST